MSSMVDPWFTVLTGAQWKNNLRGRGMVPSFKRWTAEGSLRSGRRVLRDSALYCSPDTLLQVPVTSGRGETVFLMADRISRLESQVALLERELEHIGTRQRFESEFREHVHTYVESIRCNACVREVLVEEGADGWTVWTVVEAPPFEDLALLPIFDQQVRLVRDLPSAMRTDFRVINLSELPDGVSKDDMLHEGLDTVWSRNP